MSFILIITGENSGEKYGARLVHEFKKLRPSFQFFGIGGQEMEREGVDLLYSIQEMGLVGGLEVVSHFPRLIKIFNHLKKEIHLKKPKAAVLIDSPDFNLRLAKKLKKYSIPILYYVSPTVWAWRKKRLETIRKTVSKMLLIFPFEEKIYQSHQIPAAYIGHPLSEITSLSLTKEEFYQKYELNPQKKIIALMPGSRKSELKFHLPILLKAVAKMNKEFQAQFLLLKAENIETELLEKFLLHSKNSLKILTNSKYEALAYSHLALAACGTSNLEAALLGTPLISFYRIFPFTYILGVKFIKIKNYSIVNILAGKRIIPELIQRNFTPEKIFQQTTSILESDKIKSIMVRNFQEIKKTLVRGQPSLRAAQELEKLVRFQPEA